MDVSFVSWGLEKSDQRDLLMIGSRIEQKMLIEPLFAGNGAVGLSALYDRLGQCLFPKRG